MGLSRIAIAGLAALLLASCGGGGGTSGSGGSQQPSTTPVIVNLSPESIPPGSNDFTLTVNGANFRSDSVVLWNDNPKTTSFVSASQVTASIPKTDVANGATVNVRVSSATGGATSTVPLKVQFPKPTITSISKTSAAVNDPAFILTVNGTNFFTGAHVQWDGIDRVTQVVSSTQVTAQILASDLMVGGNHTIRVSNPSPNAGISDAVNFFVQAPKPTITSITPDPVYAGSAPVVQTFTITGTNFFSSSWLYFDGQQIGTANGTSTQITIHQATPRRLGPLEIKVSNDQGGPQTATASVTLVPSGSGIQTTTLRGPLVNDDLKENVYEEITGATPATSSRLSIYDTCIGVPSCTPQNHPILDAQSPAQRNMPTSLSAGGRYIVYVPGYQTLSFHYLADLVFDTCRGATAGCAPMSYPIAATIDGSQPDGGNCDITGCSYNLGASISGNGRYTVFASNSTNLIANDTNSKQDVFLRDMCLGAPAGCPPTTVRIAADAGAPSMSRDARFIYYQTSAFAIYAYDTCIGQSSGCVPGAVLVGIDDTSTQTNVSAYRGSLDGRYVAFTTSNTATGKLYVRDTCLGVAGACTRTTILMNNLSPPVTVLDAISPDGQHIAVTTLDTFGDPADTNGQDVYVIKTCVNATGPCTQAAKRISVDAQGIQVGGSSASFSADGQRIIYARTRVGNELTDPILITGPLTLP